MEPVTVNDLLDALEKFGKAQAKRPAGTNWYTLQELSSLRGLTVPALKYRMDQARKRGVQIDMAPGTQLDDEGNPKKAIYYKLRGVP